MTTGCNNIVLGSTTMGDYITTGSYNISIGKMRRGENVSLSENVSST